jgi:hypothetical protein
MKKFKFFERPLQFGIDSHNGVTDPNLIELSSAIWSCSDWITSVYLTNNNGDTEDCLIIDFGDIDGSKYTCKIYTNRSFQIFQVIKTEDGDIELMDTLDLADETLLDYDYIIQYLSNLPNTLASSLY